LNNLFHSVKSLCDSLRGTGKHFSLFALMMPESSETWDLVVKAPWLKDTLEDYRSIASKMKRALSPSDMLAINRIVIIEDRKPMPFAGALPAHLGEIRNFFFGGTAIKVAYIFESEAVRPASRSTHSQKRTAASKGGKNN